MDNVNVTLSIDSVEEIIRQVGAWETPDIADFVNTLAESVSNAKSNHYEDRSCKDIADRLNEEGRQFIKLVYNHLKHAEDYGQY